MAFHLVFMVKEGSSSTSSINLIPRSIVILACS